MGWAGLYFGFGIRVLKHMLDRFHNIFRGLNSLLQHLVYVAVN